VKPGILNSTFHFPGDHAEHHHQQRERFTGDPAKAGQVVPGVQGGDLSHPEGEEGALEEGGGSPGEGMSLRALLTAVLALCLIGATLPSHPLHLSGTVRFKSERVDIRVEGLSLFVKAGGRILAKSDVDKDGRYAINFTPGDQPTFDFYYAGLGHDTTFIRSFTRFESDVMTWNIDL
jgi:hypothetical protein